MDPNTGEYVKGDYDVSKGFRGSPLTHLVIVSPQKKPKSLVTPCDTIAGRIDMIPVEPPGTYHYSWAPDPQIYPFGRVYFVYVEITDSLGHKGWDMVQVELFKRGDVNGDGLVNSADVVYLITYLFVSGPAPYPLEAGDANCDSNINSADAAYLINYLFVNGPPPGCP